MVTNILTKISDALQNSSLKPDANTQAADSVVPSAHSTQIPIPREVIKDLSSSKTESSQAGTTALEMTMTPKEISNAKLATQEFNPIFLKQIAADLQPTLLKPTGSKEEQITNLTNLITDVLAGKNPAIPEFKYDRVLNLSNREPAESFLGEVVARYHTEATNKDNYQKTLPKEELTKLVRANLEPLASLAVKLGKTSLTTQVSNLLGENLDTNRHYSFFTPRRNNLTRAISAASDALFTELATKSPKLLEAMLDNHQRERSYTFSPEAIANTLLRVSDEGFNGILESFKSHPDSLVKALVNITAKEVNPFVGYNFDDLTKGTQAR
ncbi:MAG: hypothetical protein ACKO3R_00225, partial [bacterium]